MSEIERHSYDVVVVGAGGAGLRAAIGAHEAGARTAVVCKSLLGKAHTVMAEGGIAASMGNVWPEDNWQVHFRDTMRGGKMLNHWRMAQLHAQEAPDRVWELESWGALFDRTKEGKISQRDFGGHRRQQFQPIAQKIPFGNPGALGVECGVNAAAPAMSHDDDMRDFQFADGEFHGRGRAVQVGVRLVGRHEIGNVAHNEELAGPGIENGLRRRTAVGAGDDEGGGTLPFPG